MGSNEIISKPKISHLIIGLLATSVNKKYRDQILACRSTWVPESEELGVPVKFFGGSNIHPETPVINLSGVLDDYSSASYKQFVGLKYLYENHPSDFYFFGGTDNYIIPKRMLDFVNSFDPTELLYMGGHGWNRNIDGKSVYFHSGGGGFILSHALMKILYERNFLSFDTIPLWRNVCQGGIEYLKDACDVAMAYILDKYIPGVRTVCDNEFYGCSCYGRMHNDMYPCCLGSKFPNWDSVITLHYMEPADIQEYHLYRTSLLQEIIPDPDWTFVTCIMNDTEIPAYDDIEKYAFVLNLHVNLVIFCNTALVDVIRDIRHKQGLATYTDIIPISTHELPLFDHFDLIKYNRINYNRSPNTSSSATHALLSCSKFSIMNIALKNARFEYNPSSKHFYGWVNCDLAYSTGSHPAQVYRAMKQYREKCSFCYIDHTNKEVTLNREQYYLSARCGTACNFFTGSRTYMAKLCELFNEEFLRTLKAGYLHLEEQLIPPIYYANPDLFEFYYGDYFTVLANYDHIRINPCSVLNYFVTHSRLNGDYSLCFQAADKLLDDLLTDYCILSMKEKIKLLSELSVAAFHMGKYDVCMKVLHIFDTIHEERGFNDGFSALSQQIIDNNNLLWPYIKSNKESSLTVSSVDQPLKEFAIVTIQQKIPIKNIISHPIIQKLSEYYTVIIYGDIPLTYYSLCHHKIILRPESLRDKIIVPDNTTRVILTLK